MMSPEENISLRPNVTREEAVQAFTTRGIRGWPLMRDFRPLRSVAELYVPFRLFRATIRRQNTVDSRWLAVDLFSGSLDPFRFDSAPAASSYMAVTSRNRLEARLSANEVKAALTTKLQRMLFQHGFFKMKALSIELQSAEEIFHMPYWVGLFGSGRFAKVEILDASRRRFEGSKFRSAVNDWLRQP